MTLAQHWASIDQRILSAGGGGGLWRLGIVVSCEILITLVLLVSQRFFESH